MQNLKASLLASKELTEFVKEAAVIHEINTKVIVGTYLLRNTIIA